MNSTIDCSTDTTYDGNWAWGNALSYKVACTVFAPAASLIIWFFVAYHISPLKKYPGPFLAGWTNLWRVAQVYSAEYGPRMKKLHEKYGPVVRVGPNLLDLDIPELVKVIYSTDDKWKKTDFYKNSSTFINGKITYHMFSETDSVKHARLKRPIARYFTVPSVLAMEPHMNKVLDDFCDYLDKRFVGTGKACVLGDWLSYFAWDFLGAVTFSKNFGYMEKGYDFDGTMAIADKSIDYSALCGQLPWIDHWLDKNPICHLGPPNLSNVTRIAIEELSLRQKGEEPNCSSEKPDYLQHFINSKTTHPDVVDDSTIVGYLILNLVAGADTTAIILRALFYYSLKNPRVWKRLEEEVTAHVPVDEPANHAVARSLPYLEAVYREAMRMHPAVSMPMERIVPRDGLVLPDGSVVPGGCFVGISPYIVGRNKDVYGEDAEVYRPERWLQQDGEGDDAFKARMRLWNSADLTFGGGSRICLGRHLSQMEIYKVVATLISRFGFELVDPMEKWWYSSRWFFRTKGVICNIKRRAPKD